MPEQHDHLEMTEEAQPSVPVFTGLSYVQHDDDGAVAGQVVSWVVVAATGSSLRLVSAKQSRPWNCIASTGVNRGVTCCRWTLVAGLIGAYRSTVSGSKDCRARDARSRRRDC